MNNNISAETRKEINKTILSCAMMVVKRSEKRSCQDLNTIAENNYEYVEDYITLEQFKIYIQAKVNIITTDIF